MESDILETGVSQVFPLLLAGWGGECRGGCEHELRVRHSWV